MQEPFKLAILDMYQGEPNQGMRCIIDILHRFNRLVTFQIFDVRSKQQIPSLQDFDLFISTGGPGNPLIGDGIWEEKWHQWLQDLWEWNQHEESKKHLLLICHSFQMACHHFGIGEISQRKSTSFGVMSIHKVNNGISDALFEGLQNPFYAIDSRDFQVIQPKVRQLRKIGAEIISLEKIRNHVEYERAIMGIRFSKEIVGLQFHPEADALSFIENLKSKEKREKIIELKGRAKFLEMLEHLIDEEKIYKTNETIVPNFIRMAIQDLMKTKKEIIN